MNMTVVLLSHINFEPSRIFFTPFLVSHFTPIYNLFRKGVKI
nr:MAG TPA: hypothetical protein [Caudoviricetes sp.]